MRASLLVCALAVSVAHAANPDPSRIAAHVRFLSSDLLEGRGVGARGGQIAEEYIAASLAGAGVKPAAGNGTFFQTVPMIGIKTSHESTLTATRGTESLPLRFADDFVGTTHRQNTAETIDAELVFAGHGIHSPEENWDDFKGADLKGKVLVLFTNEPQPDNPQVFKGKALTYRGRWTYKFEEATRQGALGALIIHTTPTGGYGWNVVRTSWGKEAPQMKAEAGKHALALAGWVAEAAGQKLLALAGHSVEALLKASDAREFKPIPLGIRLKGTLKADVRPIESRNVVGIVEGSDAALKSEAVVFTAHWDHLGIGEAVEGDAIYNGAVDNATGCGMVLEIARLWSALEQKPRRSALFLFVTAEESGLLGSEYYGRNPVIPAARHALNINYDGFSPLPRTRDIVVAGAERTTAWDLVQSAAKRFNYEIKPDPRPEQGSYYRSDHFSLAKVGIPAFSVRAGSEVIGKDPSFADKYFATFNAKHYHQPSDEFDPEWDFSGMERLTEFGFVVGLNAANTDRQFTWQPGDEFLSLRR
jgi:Zn-dependent M28 family amino/carboxypeptidase